jgi:hypothetical protein
LRLTLGHHFAPEWQLPPGVGDRLDSPGAWDALRSAPNAPVFTVPESREHWLAVCASNDSLASKAELVARFADSLQVSAITSYGVGNACLEYHIHKARPELQLELSDYAPLTVARLRAVFREADSIDVIDLLADDLGPSRESLVLLHRIDTEFTSSQWHGIFERLYDAGVQHILFAPAQLLTVKSAVKEILRRAVYRLVHRPLIAAGWIRTRSVFMAAWKPHYRLVEEGSDGATTYFLLARTS